LSAKADITSAAAMSFHGGSGTAAGEKSTRLDFCFALRPKTKIKSG
jgi:hypothetical protein